MYRNTHAAGIKWEKCLICLLNGLTVGFKKALLTFGCKDQEERLCCVMRMRTEGELVVYLQSAKNSHKLFSERARLPHVKLDGNKSPPQDSSNTVEKNLLSKATQHRARLPNMVAARVRDTLDFKDLGSKKPNISQFFHTDYVLK